MQAFRVRSCCTPKFSLSCFQRSSLTWLVINPCPRKIKFFLKMNKVLFDWPGKTLRFVLWTNTLIGHLARLDRALISKLRLGVWNPSIKIWCATLRLTLRTNTLIERWTSFDQALVCKLRLGTGPPSIKLWPASLQLSAGPPFDQCFDYALTTSGLPSAHEARISYKFVSIHKGKGPSTFQHTRQEAHSKNNQKVHFKKLSEGPFEGYIRSPFEGGNSRSFD